LGIICEKKAFARECKSGGGLDRIRRSQAMFGAQQRRLVDDSRIDFDKSQIRL
jgi:hypothetical protein